MFIDNGDGTYCVKFYRQGVIEYVTVDTWFPSRDGILVYAQLGRPMLMEKAGLHQQSLWVALAEKAFVLATASGWTGQSPDEGYGSKSDFSKDPGISGGHSADVLKLLSLQRTESHSLMELLHLGGDNYVPHLTNSISLINSVKPELMSPKAVGTIISTGKFGLSNKLYREHAYILTHADENGVVLFNPWGIDSNAASLVNLTWTELYGSVESWVNYV
jgi:hypothetical protein